MLTAVPADSRVGHPQCSAVHWLVSHVVLTAKLASREKAWLRGSLVPTRESLGMRLGSATSVAATVFPRKFDRTLTEFPGENCRG